MSETIFTKTRDVMAAQLGVDSASITMESSFNDNFGAVSLDLVKLSMALEEIYDVEISEEDAQKMVSVGDAVKYIELLE